MDIRKIIREEFDWIRDIEPIKILGKAFVFEPMINMDEYIKVVEEIKEISELRNDRTPYWSQSDLDDYKRWNPFDDSGAIFLHHLIILSTGETVWGGEDEFDFEEEYNNIERYEQDMVEWIDRHPETIEILDGRSTFNL